MRICTTKEQLNPQVVLRMYAGKTDWMYDFKGDWRILAKKLMKS